jgi:iron(III) transport system permease protein
MAPAVSVLLLALQARGAGFGGPLLGEAALNTLSLTVCGGGFALALGAGAALLVELCRFPGRTWFAWLLALPLAAPSYVLAYAYSSMSWAGGFLPFEMSGFWGACFVYAVGLYPYVYLSLRAGLAGQAGTAFEAARTLGAGPRALVAGVALPLARPALAAGGALAAMEIAADYGAAQHFGVTTLATAVFRAWYAYGDRDAAMQIAALLLLGALALLTLERRARGKARFASKRARAPAIATLPPLRGVFAAGFCTLLIGLGAGLPLAWLARLAMAHANGEDLLSPLFNTLKLAGAGTALTLALALLVALASRQERGWLRVVGLAAGIGYAAPGAVIALGALAAFGVARQFGLVSGIGEGLFLAGLLWVYAARFAAAGAQPIEAGLARAAPNLGAAAATLGAGGWRRVWSIDAPIAAPSMAAGGLIVFVEIVKELPATLILRPFDFDTLAVTAHAYASDERLPAAAAPALLIFAAGLAPMLLLSGRVSGR